MLAPTPMPNIHTHTQYTHHTAPSRFPPMLPSHRLGSKVTPCHKVPSCAFADATLSPLAMPTGLMCLWYYLRPHWRRAEGAGRTGHWLSFGTRHCLFYITSLSLSLSAGKAPKASRKVCLFVCVQIDVHASGNTEKNALCLH